MPIEGAPCPLCGEDGGVPIVRAPRWRVVRVTDTPAHPAFYRVIWNAHVAEFSDLQPPERAECLDVVVAVEQVLRDALAPTKINLASLGNLVPHLHWHVIARFVGDSHFPAPVWAPAQREADPAVLEALRARLPALDRAVAVALGKLGQHR